MAESVITSDHHRALAVEANNATWALLTTVREARAAGGDHSVTGLVRGAYAAAYH